MKYSQKNDYRDNEFNDMPSTDYCTPNCPNLTIKSINDEMETIKAICGKHGFEATTILKTFGGGTPELLIYKRIDVDNDFVNAIDAERKMRKYDLMWSLMDCSEPLVDALHTCVNELDKNVNVLFECGWAGNVGKYGSDNVRYKSYSFIGLWSWSALMDKFDLITDVRRKLRKGVYLIASSRYGKFDPDCVIDNFAIEDALSAAQAVEGINAEIVHGKRQCDSDCEPYDAILVTTADGSQLGSLKFDVNDLTHIVTAKVRKVLCGEYSTNLKTDFRQQIMDMVSSMK